MNQYKTCTGCEQTLSIECFSPSKLGKFSVRSKCKPCCRKQSKQYRMNNADKVSEYNKRYRAENPERAKFYRDKFRAENPDYAREYHAQYRYLENKRSRERYWSNTAKESLRKRRDRLANPEKYRERNRRYAQNNRQKLNAKSARRRALKENAAVFFISKRELWHLYNGKCFYCNKPSETMDHVIPLKKGGSHGVGNLVPCCGSCNYSKRDLTVMEWKVWKSRLGLP